MLTDPAVADRLLGGARQVGRVIVDPHLRSAESIALLARQATREANILAFNDVFIVIGLLSCLMFLWGVSIEVRMRLRGEPAPTALLLQKLAAMSAAQPSQGKVT